MCGIAAVWSQRPIADRATLTGRIDAALAHRGPDGHGSAALDDGRLLFVHRRLAIIDPSDGGAQPMSTPDGRYTIIFNGEIYNHRDLRRALAATGVRFVTQSDTEVLMRLVIESGPAGLAKARGMFAFALWDAIERTLLVARDRFGIKPLYLSARRGDIALASEIRTLLASDLCERDVDPAGVLAFLRWGAIPGTLTWLRGVQAVEPGAWMQWGADRTLRTGRFADVRNVWSEASAGAPSTEEELRARTREAVEDSVRAHLVADVPVGFFLSGGIDSGALVATAAAQRADLHTFTVVFDEASHSEEPFARAVAEQFGTSHHTLRVDPHSMLDQWTDILGHMDQPTIDGINSYFVSRAVAAHGVKAVISGIGGDELFGGYPAFRRVPRGTRLSLLPRPLRALGNRLAGAPGSWRSHKLQHATAHADSVFELYRAVRGWTMPSEMAGIAGPALEGAETVDRADHAETHAVGARDAGVHATVARLESTMYLRQQLLRDADVMSMAHGLELRVPLVDHELAGAVWPDLGAYPSLLRGKQLLVDVLQQPLPDAVVLRPKQGFTLPFEHWIDGPVSDFVASGLSLGARDGWLAPSAPSEVMKAWKSRSCHWSRPWGLAVLGHFLHA
jgi:asparagine synthase (glutamine-hydrolysing)